MRFKQFLQENVITINDLYHWEDLKKFRGTNDIINVTGNVDLTISKETSFGVSFGKVNGRFFVDSNYLTSLEGCPTEIGSDFDASDNNLSSLIGIHKLIKRVNGTFNIAGNRIKEGGIGLLLIDGIKEIYADHSAFDIINKYLDQGKMGILACQEELIENGYEEFAKL